MEYFQYIVLYLIERATNEVSYRHLPSPSAIALLFLESLSTLSIAANANLLNLPLSSLALTIKPNPLELPHDRKHRQETYNKLNQLIFGIRPQKLKAKKKEIYELPPLVKQIIRCFYPSDIDDNNCLQKPDIVFNLKAFIELFHV
ncbi:unnamed protein product [Rotaria magnacalcarata]|uniref:Uncharacterized protein n=1 Tax=Rotaria magnacalcarata TaxID=392030 RepID=A0A816N103_9BILA|nr:unnamed protein product [Rotaria magnacalcarata]CAF4234514.1 unnamed protein product [Rotaria magnacalcarata]